jgi:hypothetical protein
MQFLNTKVLGIIGIIGAPWLFIDFLNNGLFERFMLTSESGIRNFLFMTGWTCSVLALYRLKAMGNKPWQRIIMIIQLVLLCIANWWNVWEIFDPNSPSTLYFIIGFGWPVAGCFMLITGIVIYKAKKLKGWTRYMPLLAGLWFPFGVVAYSISPGSLTSTLISGFSSILIFSLLGLSVIIDNYEPAMRRKPLL